MKDFYIRVYNIASQIPRGKVATYGQIAVMIGEPRSARIVGWAMKATPEHLNLPCHRVVNRLGQMAPSYAFGAKDIQREILESEGITFKEDGCIDLSKYLWGGGIMNKANLEQLIELDVFKDIATSNINKLQEKSFIKKLKKKEQLFMERDKVNTIYIVLKGKVTLYKNSEEGQKKVVYLLNEGEIINEVIFDELPASISCEAFEDSEILCFLREDLLECMEKDFVLTKRIIDSMAKKIRRLYRQLKNTVPIKMDKRVAAKLWKLSKDYGKEIEGGVLIDLNLTVTYLAEMLGSSRETISRCLKGFEEKEMIYYQGKKIVIKNREELSLYFKGV